MRFFYPYLPPHHLLTPIIANEFNDWLECYGNHLQAIAPSFDRLRKQRFLSSNSLCAAAVCKPSRIPVFSRRRQPYLSYREGEDELYDIKADPNEWQNLASEAEHQPILESMRAKLEIKLSEIAP